MLTIGQPSNIVLNAFLERQCTHVMSYKPVGATRKAERPDGYLIDFTEVILGRGQQVFERARSAFQRWVMHHTPILTVWPRELALEPSQVIALVVRVGFVSITSTCQIVYTINESREFGFGYGTMRDHPARGEERFLLEWRENDVVLSLFADSKPSSLLFWLGLPVTRLMQKVLTTAYIDNMRAAVAT